MATRLSRARNYTSRSAGGCRPRTQAERSVVVVDVVLVVFVAVADGDHSGHGHVYGHDFLRLSGDCGPASPLPEARALG
jgi:hypothetical protein